MWANVKKLFRGGLPNIPGARVWCRWWGSEVDQRPTAVAPRAARTKSKTNPTSAVRNYAARRYAGSHYAARKHGSKQGTRQLAFRGRQLPRGAERRGLELGRRRRFVAAVVGLVVSLVISNAAAARLVRREARGGGDLGAQPPQPRGARRRRRGEAAVRLPARLSATVSRWGVRNQGLR